MLLRRGRLNLLSSFLWNLLVVYLKLLFQVLKLRILGLTRVVGNNVPDSLELGFALLLLLLHLEKVLLVLELLHRSGLR